MATESNCATPEELERIQSVARRYCTCGWPNPLRIGKPECDVHALFAVEPTRTRLVLAYRLRARLFNAEFG
jgi:hypothetical protein